MPNRPMQPPHSLACRTTLCVRSRPSAQRRLDPGSHRCSSRFSNLILRLSAGAEIIWLVVVPRRQYSAPADYGSPSVVSRAVV